jgi:acyl-coenzyme A synthetase/AMP-(fatty) acid ligase
VLASVEAAIGSHPAVRSVVAVLLPLEVCPEGDLWVFVVPSDPAGPTPDLALYCSAILDLGDRPLRLRNVPSLPRSRTGCIRRDLVLAGALSGVIASRHPSREEVWNSHQLSRKAQARTI